MGQVTNRDDLGKAPFPVLDWLVCVGRRLSRSRGLSETGDTLVEVLLALVVMGLAIVAILGGFATSISATAEHRTIATADTVLRSFVETATYEIQYSPSPQFQKCASDSTYKPIADDFTKNSPIAKQNKYTVTIATGGVTSLGTAACNSPNPPPQSIKAVATSSITGGKDSLTFVVAVPGSNPGTGSISVSTVLGGPGGQASGPWGGGTTVYISGSGFSSPAQVFFGAAQVLPASNVTVVSPTQITAISPQMAGTADPVHVKVVDSLGTTSPSPADLFTYGPSVTGLSTTNGPPAGGNTTTITGTGFSGVTEVDFVPAGLPDGSPGTAVACSSSTTDCGTGLNASTSLTVTVPKSLLPGIGAAGIVDVVVITPAGQSASVSADQYTYGVSVTGLAPKSGSDAGGYTVVISGFGFTGVGTVPGTSVTFGGVAATVQTALTTNTSLTVTAPASAIGPGDVDVVVTAPTGTSATSPSDKFTYSPGPSVGLGIDLVSTGVTVACAHGTGSSCATPSTGFCVMTGSANSTTCQISGVKKGGSALFYIETVDAQGTPTNEDINGVVTTSPLTITISGTGATPPTIQIPAGASTTSPNTVTVTGSTTLTMGSYTLNVTVK